MSIPGTRDFHLSVVFSTAVIGTALIDPWIMLENYPPAIRELVTPPNNLPIVLPVVIGLGMTVVLVWLMVRSAVALARDSRVQARTPC